MSITKTRSSPCKNTIGQCQPAARVGPSATKWMHAQTCRPTCADCSQEASLWRGVRDPDECVPRCSVWQWTLHELTGVCSKIPQTQDAWPKGQEIKKMAAKMKSLHLGLPGKPPSRGNSMDEWMDVMSFPFITGRWPTGHQAPRSGHKQLQEAGTIYQRSWTATSNAAATKKQQWKLLETSRWCPQAARP